MKRVDAWQAQNPDRGNETEGVTVALDGSRFWLSIDEAATLERVLGSARFAARAKEDAR